MLPLQPVNLKCPALSRSREPRPLALHPGSFDSSIQPAATSSRIRSPKPQSCSLRCLFEAVVGMLRVSRSILLESIRG